jgi:hypothetical protein
VQTGPADLVTLNEGHGESGGGGIESSGVAPRATADYDNIELLTLGSHSDPFCVETTKPLKF